MDRVTTSSAWACVALAWLLCACSQSSYAQEGVENVAAPEVDYRRGSARLGAFWVDGLSTQVYFGPEDRRAGVRTDLETDLGLENSLTAFRASLVYRVSRRHGFNAGFYELKLDGIKTLTNTIELGDRQFDVGGDVASDYEEKIFKLAYNFIFHDDGKVILSVAPGIHFARTDFSIETRDTLVQESESASTTAPLPMFGGRLIYRITPRLAMIASADVFFLTQSSREGALSDAYVVFEHQTFERIGFGAGLNRFSLNLEFVRDGRQWDWESVYTGAFLFMTVNF